MDPIKSIEKIFSSLKEMLRMTIQHPWKSFAFLVIVCFIIYLVTSSIQEVNKPIQGIPIKNNTAPAIVPPVSPDVTPEKLPVEDLRTTLLKKSVFLLSPGMTREQVRSTLGFEEYSCDTSRSSETICYYGKGIDVDHTSYKVSFTIVYDYVSHQGTYSTYTDFSYVKLS